MKIIVAGMRDYFGWEEVLVGIALAERRGIFISTLVCGMAPGVDETAYIWAKLRGIPIIEMPADWTKYGNAAGPIRNTHMSLVGDGLVAIWNKYSPGTGDMIKKMAALNKPHYVHYV